MVDHLTQERATFKGTGLSGVDIQFMHLHIILMLCGSLLRGRL